MITRHNLLRHEFIGLSVKVTKASDKGLAGVEGEVFDETRNMLIVNSKGRLVSVPKKDCGFLFTLPGGEGVEVDGKAIAARPEDRVKKKF